MILQLGFFYFYATVAVAGALGLVFAPKLVHAVMSFFATLFAVAGLFMLLGSQFLASLQLFVYGGAVTVLVLFALMFTGAEPEGGSSSKGVMMWISAGVSASFFVVLAMAFGKSAWNTVAPHVMDAAAIANILFSRYVLPFEIVGLALTIALIGAVVLAREDDVVEEVVAEPATEPLIEAVAET